jgi:SAM-dependent methyltransferase
MERSHQQEILESPGLAGEEVALSYRQLTRIHRVLGDIGVVTRAIRRDPLPVRRVLDIGCGAGGVLRHIQRRLGVEVVGVDLEPPECVPAGIQVIRANAVRDALPQADVAYSLMMAHHLPEQDVIELIRNAGRSCRRFILLDPVRHPLPLALFRAFVAPFVSHVTASDGCVSIQRSFTPAEMRSLVQAALAGTNGRFRHSVAPLYVRQVADISYQRS